MSAKMMRSPARLAGPPAEDVDKFDNDDAYDLTPPEEFEPGGSVSMDSFTPDVMCTKCGLWRTEHEWEKCPNPSYQ